MALSAEAEFVLRTIEERGIRYIRLWFTDVLGFLKSFTITSQELEGAFTEGMGFDGSSIDGLQPDPGVGHGRDPRPVHVPDRSRGRPRRRSPGCSATSFNPDGTPFEGDPRVVLKRQLAARVRSRLHASTSGPSSSSSTSRAADDPTFLDQGGYFDETPLDVATDWRKRTVAYLESMGIPVEYVHHEVAPSQHEIDLRYTDALTMADNVMTYRLTVKEVAQEFGIYATFMPKPVDGRERQRDAHPPVAVRRATATRSSTPSDEYHLSKTREALHRGHPAPRARDHAGHEPVGELVQAADPRLRGAGVRVLGAAEPLGARPRPDVQARARRRRRGSSSARPIPRATRTSRSPRCSPPAWPAIEDEYELPPEASNNIYEMSEDERRAAGIRSLPGRPARGDRARRATRRCCARRSASTSTSS